MTHPPLVSIVIPCYNGAAFLPAAVRSVRNQSDSVTEVIIVDDLSTDDSALVAEQFAATDPAVRVIRRPVNGAPAAARNTGLRVATGRYIGFLDADAEYAPGFLSTAVRLLDADPTVAGLVTGIELLGCHRPVHPAQFAAVARSLPANLLVRRATVDLLGGFPEDPAFRGPLAGEDIAFREALACHFRLTQTDHPYLRYRVRPGGHFDRFLDSTAVVGDQLVFTRTLSDERSVAVPAALARYHDRVRDRLRSGAAADGPDGAAGRGGPAVGAADEFDALRVTLGSVPGFLDPHEGYALYRWARDGPGVGSAVEIGSLLGLSTGWLAAGCRDGRRERVVAVDHFRGSPEHQPGGTHPVAEVASGGSTLSAFRAHLARAGLANWVEPRVGDSVAVGRAWTGPVRLLFVDGDHSYEASRADWRAWIGHLIPGGVVGFHDVGVWPGVTRLYDEVRAANPGLREVGRVRTLRLLQLPPEPTARPWTGDGRCANMAPTRTAHLTDRPMPPHPVPPRPPVGTGSSTADPVEFMQAGVALAQRGQFGDALPLLERAVRLAPDSPPARLNLGAAPAASGRPVDAAAQLREAVRLNPDYADAHFNLANVLRDTGKVAEAIDHFRTAVRLRPDHMGALTNLGLILTSVGRPAEAVALLQHAVRLDPTMKEAHNNLGLTFADMGRFAEPEAAYGRALQLDPRSIDALSNLAAVYKDQGRLDEALGHYDLALAYTPGAVSVRYNRSLALLQAGNYTRGWSEYEWRWRRGGRRIGSAPAPGGTGPRSPAGACSCGPSRGWETPSNSSASSPSSRLGAERWSLNARPGSSL